MLLTDLSLMCFVSSSRLILCFAPPPALFRPLLLASSASRHEYFFSDFIRFLKKQHTPPALCCSHRTQKSSCASTQDDYVVVVWFGQHVRPALKWRILVPHYIVVRTCITLSLSVSHTPAPKSASIAIVTIFYEAID